MGLLAPAYAQDGILNKQTVEVEVHELEFPGNLTSFVALQDFLDELPPAESLPVGDRPALEALILDALLAAGLDPDMIAAVGIGAPSQESSVDTELDISTSPDAVVIGDDEDVCNIVVLQGQVDVLTTIRTTFTTTIPIAIGRTIGAPAASILGLLLLACGLALGAIRRLRAVLDH